MSVGLCFSPTNSPTIILSAATVNGGSQTVVYSPLSAAPGGHTDTSICQTSEDPGQIEIYMSDGYPGSREEEEELREMATRWSNVISERKQDFMVEHELSTANCRVYGIAPSPLGGVIAAACSFHPDDSLEYITAAKESTRIVFGTHEGSGGIWEARGFIAETQLASEKVPNPLTRAAEALLLEVETLGERREQVVDSIKRSLSTAHFEGSGLGLDGISVSSDRPEDSLSANILLAPSLNALRYSICLDIIPGNGYPGLSVGVLPPRENAEIIAHIINSILRAPRDKIAAESMLSKRMVYSVACIGILGLYNFRPVLEAARGALSWLSGVDETFTDEAGDTERSDVDVTAELQIVERRIADLDVIERGDDDGSGLVEIRAKDKGFTSKFEKCTLCGGGMVWTDLRLSECTQGHRFSRCALTFLPIKEPRLTKECTICSRTVLGDAVLDDDEMDMENRDVRLEVGEKTLARTVLEGLDVCAHCGGRYWAKGS